MSGGALRRSDHSGWPPSPCLRTLRSSCGWGAQGRKGCCPSCLAWSGEAAVWPLAGAAGRGRRASRVPGAPQGPPPPGCVAEKLRSVMVSTPRACRGRVGYLPGGPSHSFRVLGEGQIWNRGILKQTQHSSVTHVGRLGQAGGQLGPGQGAEQGTITPCLSHDLSPQRLRKKSGTDGCPRACHDTRDTTETEPNPGAPVFSDGQG